MGLSDFARRTALSVIEAVWEIAAPQADLSEVSPIRHIILIPFAQLFATVYQEIATLESLSTARAQELSETDFDLIASNFPGAGTRPSGARSTTTMRIYLREAEALSLQTFPYFRTTSGDQYAPVEAIGFRDQDVRVDANGDLYVDVAAVSVAFGVTASSGEINQFVNMPGNVIRVENIRPAIGGRSRATNEEYFEFIQRTRSDGTRTQADGLLEFVSRSFLSARDVEVVDAASPLMIRDEVFTVDGVTPNLSRQGYPLAPRVNLGVLDFEQSYRRVTSAVDIFTDDMIHRRISIDGDQENHRKILKVISPKEIVVSGPPLYGSAQAHLWGRGEKTLGKSDVYVYFPLLHVRSLIIDKRSRLFVAKTALNTDTRVYYQVATNSLRAPESAPGYIVFNQGTQNEWEHKIIGMGEDMDGFYLELGSMILSSRAIGTPFVYYPQPVIEIKEGGDIDTMPVMYVAQIERLDPNTLEPTGTIPKSAPGAYDQPGYYVSTPDPAQLMSAKEDKMIVIDAKKELNSFKDIYVPDASIIGTTQLPGFTNKIQRSGISFEQTEGRIAKISVGNRSINQPAFVGVPVVAVEPKKLTLDTTHPNFAWMQFFTEDGGRSELVEISIDIPSIPLSYVLTDCKVYGDTIERTDNDVFVGAPGDYDPVAVDFKGPITKPPYELEAPVLYGAQDEIDVFVVNGLNSISVDSNTTLVQNVLVHLEDQSGDFHTAPIRVVYYTHPDFLSIQTELDNPGTRQLCCDTLTRSYLPALIDITLEYRGLASPQAIQDAFVQLLQSAVSRIDVEDSVKIDVSDVLDAVNREGISSAFQPNFEVRVTLTLDDGEEVVRYLNPSKKTKQTFSIASAVSPSALSVLVRGQKDHEPPPPRGRIALGGLNPATQEMLPYEAVIQVSSDQYELILRSGQETSFAHPEWEPCLVGVRDWEPELEYTDNAIIIPKQCRPYLRQGLFIRRG